MKRPYPYMKCFMISLNYDLHIHSCLSPCGDDDMTPANIVGMAALKGLDVIAVTDHNSCRNCPAVLKWAEEYGIIAIPGMELTTMEEVHVVCLFENLSNALAFDGCVYEKLMPVPNDEEVFGKQLLYNEQDEPVGNIPNLLINATEIMFDDVYALTQRYGGIMIPAHIDKSANSLLANLGFVPPDSRFTCVELKNLGKLHEIQANNPYIKQCRVINDSDAHYLEHIHEAEHTLYSAGREIKDILFALAKSEK